jgi:hypothetical protein
MWSFLPNACSCVYDFLYPPPVKINSLLHKYEYIIVGIMLTIVTLFLISATEQNKWTTTICFATRVPSCHPQQTFPRKDSKLRRRPPK